ncbi:Uncharacterised protein [Streptococcus suis]|nr:Uncharacterised protein [Streptococcus suis]CYW85995.1 Uncharacterised protein [Streptococcus suis]
MLYTLTKTIKKYEHSVFVGVECIENDFVF